MSESERFIVSVRPGELSCTPSRKATVHPIEVPSVECKSTHLLRKAWSSIATACDCDTRARLSFCPRGLPSCATRTCASRGAPIRRFDCRLGPDDENWLGQFEALSALPGRALSHVFLSSTCVRRGRSRSGFFSRTRNGKFASKISRAVADCYPAHDASKAYRTSKLHTRRRVFVVTHDACKSGGRSLSG